MTFVEIRCPPGSPPAIATSLGGAGTPDANYPLTQVANWLHTMDVSGLTGRWQFDVSSGNAGSRIVEMVDDDSTIRIGDTGDAGEGSATYTVTIPAIAADALENGLETEVTRYRGTLWALQALDIGSSPAKIVMTIKANAEPDADAILQVLLTTPADAGDGLQILNGAPAADKSLASIVLETYETTKIRAVAAIDAAATALIRSDTYRVDFKELDSPDVLAEGTIRVIDPVTDATQ